ncbi:MULTISPECIES: ATP synthase F1 subunit delta [Soonwooa]|uniref:ATP synthase subunit delta n=1 Tax=Soonwooa buanensis TaxID=619805 RepID=A0A1T5DW75_9FLAO|nr:MULTISPECIES: ATP synthase F1 subunit delta [Soonwooa]SKB75977.1 F-type H+-transporting ATPase subunit delta [Soonwooa buanensis]
MLTSKVAKRYAQGLLEFTQEAGSTDAVFTEMQDVVKIMSQSKELNQFLDTPFIDAKKKIEVAGEVFKAFSPVAQNLIKLTIKKGRESQLKNIAQEFINKVEDIRGTKRVSLTSATALSRETVTEILKASQLVPSNTDFEVESIINPEILGGYILRVGDKQIDASVKTKLNNIKKEFQLN